MPSSTAPSTASRTERRPARWPMRRGKPRRSAQRPFPSMMIAMCSGVGRLSTCSSVGAALGAAGLTMLIEAARAAGSNLHDFGLFLPEQLIQRSDVPVRQLLDLGLGLLGVIFGDFVLAFQLFQLVVRLTPDGPDAHASVLDDLAQVLDQVLAALLGQGDRKSTRLNS